MVIQSTVQWIHNFAMIKNRQLISDSGMVNGTRCMMQVAQGNHSFKNINEISMTIIIILNAIHIW